MPARSPERSAEARDLAACAALLRGGSRSFFAASRLLPRRVGEPATALYAFCRLADDAIDLDGGRCEALGEWRARLDAIYDGRPAALAVDRALCAVVKRHGIPRALPDALLEGFHWDALGRRYENLAQLRDYAARVAGAVGAMMAVVMGTRSPEALARACDLGVAMQLTNIARDVGEDARAGRLYLPLAWMREAGIDPDEFVARPAYTPALGAVVERLLRAADDLYMKGREGIGYLPPSCRPGIRAAGLLYAEIGAEVRRRGHESVSRRAVVSGARKALLVARALGALGERTAREHRPPLDETRFLVDAAAAGHIAARDGAREGSGPGERLVRLLELFERLERRDRMLRSHLASSRRA